MAEQRPIAYKSLGFTLGLGGSGVPRAASTFLDTLISAVPSAKALLPTLVPQPLKPKAAADAGQRKEGLQSSAAGSAAALPAEQASPKQQPDNATQKQAARAEPVQAAVGAGENEAGNGAKATSPESEAGAQALTADGDVAAIPEEKPPSAEFIPLPEAAPVAPKAAAVAKAAAPGSADALADDEDIRRLGQRPYWMSYVCRIDSPLLRLHQELVELCELVQPTPEEAAARRSAVAAVTEVVRSIWPQARCEVFGSYATGLYVPTSDIDLVILDSGCTNIQSGLKALATALGKREIAQSIQVIGKARVPIIKFETVGFGNLAFDISFDVANGPQAAALVSEMTASWPMMRPLILCLKLFLQQRELNEVYTGGIGSYALITLVAAFLQLHASRRPKHGAGGDSGKQQQQPQQPVYGTSGDAALASRSGGVEPALGTLLVDFFRFYGRVVNIPEVGISCAGGGQFFRKVDKPNPDGPRSFTGWLNHDRSHLLAVEDPKDPDNDVCRNSFNIMRVKTAFEYAYQMLTAPARREESLLARILRLGPILASRPRPRVLHLRELAYYSEPPGREEQLKRDMACRLKERNQRKQQKEQQQRQQQRRQQEQQETPSDRVLGSGRKRGTPVRTGGDGSGAAPGRDSGRGRKRGREEGGPSPGSGGQGGDARTGEKKARKPETPAQLEAKQRRKGTRKERKELRKQQWQQQQPPQKQQQGQQQQSDRAGPAQGGNGGGVERPQKRRREETSPTAAAPETRAAAMGDAAADNAAPARNAKRARIEPPPPRQPPQSQAQQQQHGQQERKQQQQRKGRSGGNGRSRDGGGRQSQQQQQQQQQQHNHHQRRPALMQVAVPTVPQTAPAPQQQAPALHPGYAPPPSHQHGRHHHHTHHQHHETHHPPDRHHTHHHHGQSDTRHNTGYPGEPRAGGSSYGGSARDGGGGGGGYSRGGDESGGYGRSQAPPPSRHRAPIIMVHQQAPQSYPEPRGAQHHQYGQRTHVFFD